MTLNLSPLFASIELSFCRFVRFKVPGLFEGDDYTTLMTQCKEGSQREGLMLDSSEELYKWFTQQVSGTNEVILALNYGQFEQLSFTATREIQAVSTGFEPMTSAMSAPCSSS